MAKPQKGVADAAAKLIARYGARAVRNALKAANKPSKIRSGQTERANFMKEVAANKKMANNVGLPTPSNKEAYGNVRFTRTNKIFTGDKVDLPRKASGPKTAKDLAKMKKALGKKRK